MSLKATSSVTVVMDRRQILPVTSNGNYLTSISPEIFGKSMVFLEVK